MSKVWSYEGLDIQEGLKPGSKNFQYFYKVSEKGKKKCNYCVWIEKDTVAQFDPKGEFNAIVSSNREAWGRWVKEKINQKDFRNMVLSLNRDGQKEINLEEMEEKLSND
jgi:hypothetical protein